MASNLDLLIGAELLRLLEVVLSDSSLPASLAQLARAVSSRSAVLSLLRGADRARAEALLAMTEVLVPWHQRPLNSQHTGDELQPGMGHYSTLYP